MYLLGDVFIRSFYSVFDFDQQKVRLGLNANAAHKAGTGPVRKHTGIYIYVIILPLSWLVAFFVFTTISKRLTKNMSLRVYQKKLEI